MESGRRKNSWALPMAQGAKKVGPGFGPGFTPGKRSFIASGPEGAPESRGVMPSGRRIRFDIWFPGSL
jgi:hypothetical protein